MYFGSILFALPIAFNKFLYISGEGETIFSLKATTSLNSVNQSNSSSFKIFSFSEFPFLIYS